MSSIYMPIYRDGLNSVIKFCLQIADKKLAKKLTAMVYPLLFREAKVWAI